MRDAAGLAMQAQTMLRQGRVEDAIAFYRSALSIQPNRADDWFNLGWALRQKRAFEDALQAYAKAIEYGVRGPHEARLNRAVILVEDLNRPADAERELEAALASNPKFTAALLNLGNLQEDRGDRDAAAQCYGKALGADPTNSLALARLADVSRFDDPADPLIQQLALRLDDADLTLADRADIGFALGRALDQAGEYGGAFKAYAKANDASARNRGRAYDRAASERLVTDIIAAFPEAAPTSSAKPAPIFICGMFRSGSTLAERILARHSSITAGGELPYIPELAASAEVRFPAGLKAISEEDFQRLRAEYERRAASLGLGLAGLTDKRPDNFLYVGFIKQLFPGAKIVNTVRNEADNRLSIYFAHLGPQLSYATQLDDIEHWMGCYRRLMDHWRKLYPDDIVDFDYDALVHDPEDSIRALLLSLELSWEPVCLEPHLATNAVRTASAWQVRDPLHAGSSGRWQNYARHVATTNSA